MYNNLNMKMNAHDTYEEECLNCFLQLFSKFEIALSLPQTAAFHNRLHVSFHYTNVLIIFFFFNVSGVWEFFYSSYGLT